MKILKLIIALVFVVGLGYVVVSSQSPTRQESASQDSLQIVTALYPLADFAEQIAGDVPVTVTNVVPVGTEPHDYEPSPKDITTVLDADVLLILGGGFDTWAQELSPDVREAGGQALVLTDELTFAEAEHEDGEEEDHDHADEGIDPHIWLDLVQAQNIVALIRDAMMAADPEQARTYYVNANEYIAQLEALHQQYTAGLSRCSQNDIIVAHDAFGYLARRYGFKVHAISGLSPEAEPSLNDLAQLAQLAKELGTTTVFFESLINPDSAQTLADEIGAQTAVLDPVEGITAQASAQGQNYMSIMRDNLQALRLALVCQ